MTFPSGPFGGLTAPGFSVSGGFSGAFAADDPVVSEKLKISFAHDGCEGARAAGSVSIPVPVDAPVSAEPIENINRHRPQGQ